MQTDTDALQAALFPLVRETTSRAQVVGLVLQDDVDHDGDPILRILVIIAGNDFRLDPTETLETTRRVREQLINLNDNRFPVVTYMSEADYRRLFDEAA
jgi:hypothetical protein